MTHALAVWLDIDLTVIAFVALFSAWRGPRS